MNKYDTWTDEDLKTEFQLIMDIINIRNKKVAAKTAKELCINGITTKDISVEYGSYDGSEIVDVNDVNFSFFVNHDGKLYDIYYESGTYEKDHKGGTFMIHPWWPKDNIEDVDEGDNNRAFEFIPPGFTEACENCYEFHGTFEEAVARLKEYGITDVKQGNW